MDQQAAGPPPSAADRQRLAARSEERELVAAILRNDRKAAARLVADHADAVYAFVRRRLAPLSDVAEDVVQDVFLAALSGLGGFHGDASLRTWLIGIARHKIEDVFRQRLRLFEPLDEIDGPADPAASASPTMDEQIDAARDREKAQVVLEKIPERYALMLIWRYWERRSTREIATALGATEKSVERTLARARARFKELWLKE